MQALTPEQAHIVGSLAWEAIKALIASAFTGICWRLHRAVKSIRPGIVADVVEKVNQHADARMQAHEEKDDQRFDELNLRLNVISPMPRQAHRMHSGATGD